MTRPTDAGGEGLDSIPEYFCKPGITEALAKVHPVLLVRQMANEILRLRAPVSESQGSEWNKALEEAAIYFQEQDCAHHCGIGAEIAEKIRSRKRPQPFPTVGEEKQ